MQALSSRTLLPVLAPKRLSGYSRIARNKAENYQSRCRQLHSTAPSRRSEGASDSRRASPAKTKKTDGEAKPETEPGKEAQGTAEDLVPATPNSESGSKDAVVDSASTTTPRKVLSGGREEEGRNNTSGDSAIDASNGPGRSSVRRVVRNQRIREIPPITIPEWFLESNVILHEDRRAKPPELPARPEGRKNAKESRSQEPDDLMSARKASSQPLLSPALIDSSIRDEINNYVSASMYLASASAGVSYATAKANLMLLCPQPGGSQLLEQVVEAVATEQNADLIKIDALDIAELPGDYIYSGARLNNDDLFRNTLQPLRDLGYKTFTRPSADEGASKGVAGQDRDDAPQFSISGMNGNLPSHMEPRNPSEQPKGFTQGVWHLFPSPYADRALDSYGVASPEDLSSTSTPWDAYKLAAYLDKVVDSPALKRTLSNTPKDHESVASGDATKTRLDPSPSLSTPSEGRSQFDAIDGNFFTPAEHVRSLGKADNSANTTLVRRTIICVSDPLEMNQSDSGRAVLKRLFATVSRRREANTPIMLIGLGSREGVINELDTSQIRSFQHDFEECPIDFDEQWQKLVVPMQTGNHAKVTTSESSTASSTTKYSTSHLPAYYEGERTLKVNARHIRLAMRLLNPQAPLQSTQDMMSDLRGANHGLRARILSRGEVHRIAMAAFAQGRSRGQAERQSPIRVALGSFEAADEARDAWVSNQKRQVNEASRDPSLDDEFAAFLAELRQSCSPHEKRLLSGVIRPDKLQTSFDDVHVSATAVSTLQTLTSLSLQRPDAFEYGILATDKIAGVLLYGPPGTGKTLLAKAVARQSGATVLRAAGSDLFDMWVGESEKLVRALFTLARKLSRKRPCVVFIDEADSMFGSRNHGGGGGSREHNRSVLNEFLKEWDGMEEQGVFILAATNRPFDIDDAVLRRLPRRILVDLPDKKGRESILRIHLRGEKLAEDIVPRLAERTPRFSGSDLKNLVVTAALEAVKEENTVLAQTQTQETSATSEGDLASKRGTDASASAFPSVTRSGLLPKPAERRTLHQRHFERALANVSASISDEMSSLKGLREFDEKYGDARRSQKKGWGFVASTEDESKGRKLIDLSVPPSGDVGAEWKVRI